MKEYFKILMFSTVIIITIFFNTLFLCMNDANSLVVKLNIHAGNEVRPFSPQMLGSSLGIWTNPEFHPSAKPQLVNMIKESGMKLLRFPGGMESDLAMFDRTNSRSWYTGVAPYTRTLRADHLDSFIKLCQQTGAEPLIVVNVEVDDPAMAADIVRYLNIDKKYNVKYFEIGNEPIFWNPKVTVQEYSRRFASYVAEMKAVDPNIKVMGTASHQPTHVNEWLTPVLQQHGNLFDAVTVHWYPLWDGITDPNHRQYESLEKLLQYGAFHTLNENGSISYAERFTKTNYNSLVNLRNQYAPDALIGVTELSPVAGSGKVTGVADSLGNALWFGDVLGRLAYNGVDFVNQFLLISEPQKYALSDFKYNIKPAWYTFVMYNRYFGDMMLESASDTDAGLTVWASKKTGIDNKLFLMVINKSLTGSYKAEINLAGFAPQSQANSWLLTASSASSLTASLNGISVTNSGTLGAVNPEIISGVSKVFQHTFPAHSITAIEFTGTFDESQPTSAATITPTPTQPVPTSTPVPTLPAATPTLTQSLPTPTSVPTEEISSEDSSLDETSQDSSQSSIETSFDSDESSEIYSDAESEISEIPDNGENEKKFPVWPLLFILPVIAGTAFSILKIKNKI